MDLNLKDKIVLVTGSSRGIGRAIATFLCQEQARVILNARTKSQLDELTQILPNTVGVVGDMSNPKDAVYLIDTIRSIYNQLDVIVCNVGSGRSVPPGQESYVEWQRVFAQNVWSTTNVVEAAQDVLAQTQGNIVCISSICGLDVIPGAPITYSTAKAALHAYVRGISIPLGKKGIRINGIALGNILFNGSIWEDKISKNKDDVELMLQNEVALNKLGTVEDVAHLVAYLVSSKASFATGSIWTLDGGQVCI